MFLGIHLFRTSWFRQSLLGFNSPQLVEDPAGFAGLRGSSILIDYSADMFPGQGPGDIALFQPVDDLDLVEDLGILKDLDTRPLDDQVVKIPLNKFSGTDFADEVGIRRRYKARSRPLQRYRTVHR